MSPNALEMAITPFTLLRGRGEEIRGEEEEEQERDEPIVDHCAAVVSDSLLLAGDVQAVHLVHDDGPAVPREDTQRVAHAGHGQRVPSPVEQHDHPGGARGVLVWPQHADDLEEQFNEIKKKEVGGLPTS